MGEPGQVDSGCADVAGLQRCLFDALAECDDRTVGRLAELSERCRRASGVFDMPLESKAETVSRNLKLLRDSWSDIEELCEIRLRVSIGPLLLSIWLCWIPLARRIEYRRLGAEGGTVQGIVGPPGVGKSTAAAILDLLLKALGISSLVLSLDDLYFPAECLAMISKSDPRIKWRGPPGTHDIRNGIDILSRIKNGSPPMEVPRFDKSARGGAGERVVLRVASVVEVLIFEGWLVGLTRRRWCDISIAFQSTNSSERAFAFDMNARLSEYAGLWEMLDSLSLLLVSERSWIRGWRLEAERIRRQTKGGMSSSEAEAFVDYLLLAIDPIHYRQLVKEPGRVELVVELNEARLPYRVRHLGPEEASRDDDDL